LCCMVGWEARDRGERRRGEMGKGGRVREREKRKGESVVTDHRHAPG